MKKIINLETLTGIKYFHKMWIRAVNVHASIIINVTIKLTESDIMLYRLGFVVCSIKKILTQF